MSCFVVESGLLNASLAGSIVALIMWAANSLLRNKVSHRLWHTLWLLVLCRFVLLIVPVSSLSAWGLIEFYGTKQSAAAASELPPTSETFSAASKLPVDFMEPHVGPAIQPWAQPGRGFAVPHWLDVVWLVGLGLMLTRLICHLRFVRQLIQASTHASAWQTTMTRIGSAMNIQSARLLVTENLPSPCVVGFWKPTILIPAWLDELDGTQAELVLAHELTHVARRDGWAQLAMALVGAVHWFNPMTWLLHRQLEHHRELACDQTVVQQIRAGRITGTETEYGDALIRVAERNSNLDRGPAFARGLIDHNPALLKERIAMLNSPQKKSPFCKILLCGVCIPLLLVGGFTQLPAQEKAVPKVNMAHPEVEINPAETAPDDQNTAKPAVSGKLAIVLTVFDFEDNDEKYVLKQLVKSPPKSPCWVTVDDTVRETLTRLTQEKRISKGKEFKMVTEGDLTAVYKNGTELPFQVKRPDGKTETEFEFAGDTIRARTTALDEEKATIEFMVEVSQIDPQLASPQGVPGFRTQRISTGVEVNWQHDTTKLFCLPRSRRLVSMTPRRIADN